MKRKITAGLTSVSLPIFVRSAVSSTGGGLSGLVYNTAGLVAEYRRQGASTWTALALAAGTLGTWSSAGWIADGSLAGAYEIGIPNAALASGARWVAIRVYGAANMVPVLIEIELDAVDYQDAVRFGLTALPNAAANAAGGILTSVTDVSGAAVPGSAGAALRKANDTLDAAITSRAAPGDAMTLTSAYNAAKTAAQAGDAMGLATGAITSSKFATVTPGLTGFLERLALLVWRFYPTGSGKVTQPTTVASSGSQCKTYASDGTTVVATQTVSNDGTTETLGAAS